MIAERKLPYMKWYPSDWRSETRLKMVGRAQRSLWLDMLGLMHESEEYGYLLIAGRLPTAVQLASILGDRISDITKWLADLEAVGVFSRDERGVIFSRRMVRDKAKAEEDRANGKRGGNPFFIVGDKGGVNPPDKAHTQSPFPEPRANEEILDSSIAPQGNGNGKKNGATTIADPLERLARFQAKVAKRLGTKGWEIVASASDKQDPRHEENLALCKAAARDMDKGWPQLWQ